MKARLENGEVVIYNAIPKSFVHEGNTIIGFDNLDEVSLTEFGFFDVEQPVFDSKTQDIGDIYFDSDLNVFRYHIINTLDGLSIDEIKKIKILQLKGIAQAALSPYDWYASRKIIRGIEIPDSVISSTNKIISSVDSIESLIMSASTIDDLLSIDIYNL